MKKLLLPILGVVWFIFTFLFTTNIVFAQQNGVTRCATMENDAELRANNPNLGTLDDMERMLAPIIEQKQQNSQNPNARIVDGVYIIPVVVHVIHEGEPIGDLKNISYALIESQIETLNDDFRRRFGTNGFNTHPDGADTKIEFRLAQRKPDGSAFAEIGVNRINGDALWGGGAYGTGFIDGTIKPYTTTTQGYDGSVYMSFWCVDISGGILGYAQFPQTTISGMDCNPTNTVTDGVVMDYETVGGQTTPSAGAPYNLGRTATHEIGHWLGLRHIWGDGGCGVDDFCADTPTAGAPNFGCPPTNSCTDTPVDAPDMVENYMDYSEDACMNIFTNDQKIRMRTVLETTRFSLINSIASIPPNPSDAGVLAVLTPIADVCSSTVTPSIRIKNYGSTNLTSVTVEYRIDAAAFTSQAFTGLNVAPNGTTDLVLNNITGVALGNHTFEARTILPNGVTDPYTPSDLSNSTFTLGDGILPILVDFEGADFPPASWERQNPGNDCDLWVADASPTLRGLSGTRTKAALVRHHTYSGSGQEDILVSPYINLTGAGIADAKIEFDLAYRRRNTTRNETLRLEVSTDCGATWNTATPIYNKTGATLATVATTSTTAFIPTAANQWRREVVSLNAYLGQSIKVRFVTVNDNGNNLYIDNIKIYDTRPNIELSVATNAGSEAAPSAITVTATADNAVSGDQTVNLAVTGTGITAGDYTLSNSTITILNGQTTGSVTFTVVDDAIMESLETATLTISSPSLGVTLGATTTQDITITDNDTPVVNLSVSSNTSSEATPSAITVTATATSAVTGDQTVNLAVTGTGITAGDYTLSNSTITILDGQTTGTATFTVVDDALPEGTETATLTISNPSSGIVIGAPSSQNITITDDDDNDICTDAATITCGNTYTGSTVGKGNDNPATCGTTSGTGGGVWYKLVGNNQQVTISTCGAGTSFDTKLRVYSGSCAALTCVTGNDDDCGTASTVTFDALTGTDYYVLVHGFNTAEGNYSMSVNCVPIPNPVTLSVSSNTSSEATPSAITVTATATSAVTGDQTVNLAVTGAGITAGDYTLSNSTITILDGQTTGTATFTVVDDALPEGTETATLTISNPSSGIVIGAPSSQNITITDDDDNDICTDAATITCGNTYTGSTVGKGNDNPATCGTTSGTGGGVWYKLVGNNQQVTISTCGAGTNFDTKLRVYSGSCAALTCVTGNDDDCDRQSTVNFDAITGTDYYILVHGWSTSEGNYEMSVNCVPIPNPVTLSVSSNTSSEATPSAITVTATATSAVTGDQTVNLAVTGAGITAGDYTLSNTTITILNGQTTGTVTFTVVDDAIFEGTETATLTISSPSAGVTLGTTTTQNITITDNDIAAPAVNLSVSSTTSSEAAPSAITVTATATSAVTGDQTVNLAVTGAGITAGDYTLSNSTITILDGQTTGTATFTVVDDALPEGTETATLTISNPSSGIVIGAPSSQNITIADDDDNDICTDAATVTCGNTYTGTTVGKGNDNPTFCVTTSATGGGVWYKLVGNDQQVTISTCGAGTNFDTKLRVYSGSCAALTCVTGNDDDCGLQSTVNFDAITGTDYYVLVHGYDTSEGNYEMSVNCVPIPNPVTLSVSSNTSSEATPSAITVTATAASAVTGDQTVNLAVTGAGITAGDYTLSNTTITILNGQTTGTVTFTVVDDALIEGTETATLTISSPSAGVTLGTTTTQNITITDNDNYTIAITEYSANPSGDESTNEWVELYNYGANPVNIQNWSLKDEDTDNSVITTSSYSIAAGEYLILARGKAAFETQWLGGVANSKVIQVGMTLANTSDEIIVTDNLNNVVWSLAYQNDDTEGRATFYSESIYTTNIWGSKASPGIVRNGNDITTGTLGYESNNNTTDVFARTSTTGDIGSPLNTPLTSPEINLAGNGITISSGTTGTSTADNTAFGQTVGTPISKTFAIQNLGDAALNVSSITSSNPVFVVSNAPTSFIVNDQRMFTVTFTPTVQGVQTSTITINNNDADEAVYTFNITGEGICPTTTTITASTPTVVPNQVGSIRVESQLGVNYQLQNVDNANSNVGNSVAGTGNVIYLQTDPLTATTNFRVEAIRGLDCGNQILNTISIAVSTTVSGYGYEQTQINDCTPTSTLADIDVKLTGSTYLWSNATTSQNLTDVADGIYSLDIDNGTTILPVIVGSPVDWENPVRSTLTNEGRIVANGTYSWSAEAAATSKAKLASGESGGFTFVVEDMATISNVMIGLASPNNVASFYSLENTFYVAPNGNLYAYWNNASQNIATNTTVVAGDRLTILREGTSIKYYHNATLVYTDTQAANATKELVVDISLTSGTSPQVWFSKCSSSTFEVNYVQNSEDACNTGALEGSITLSPQGIAPYTYNWANGATAIANPTGMQTGLTSVQVTDANNAQQTVPVIIGNPVNWTSLQNVSAAQGQLFTTGFTSDYTNAGAISETGMGANTDGGITFIYQANNSSGYMIGLSAQNTDPSWTSLGYSVYIYQGVLYMYEGASSIASYEGIVAQDRVSIIRIGSEVIFYKNNEEVHRLSVDPSVDLFADATVASGQTPVIYASWCTTTGTNLGLTYTQTAVDDCTTSGTNEGAISLQGNGGTAAYTYTWNGGNTDNPRTGLARGLYEVTLASGAATPLVSPVIVGGFVNWGDLTTNATQVAGTITATATAPWTAPEGGLSTNRLAASTDGGISFVVPSGTGLSNYMIGLSSTTSTASTWESIGYSIWINSQNTLRIYESGTDQGATQAVTAGDRISIIRRSGNVEYYINSKQVRVTTTGTVTQELAADISIVEGTSPTVYASFCNTGFRIPNKVQATETTTIDTEPKESGFAIYPNPSTGIFNVRFGTVLSEDTQVTIFDGIGRKVSTQTFEKGSQKFSINLKNQPNGMYLIHFNQNGATYSKSIIIE